MNSVLLVLAVGVALLGVLSLIFFKDASLRDRSIIFLLAAGVSLGMWLTSAVQRCDDGLLVVSEYPKGYPRESRSVEFVRVHDASGYGDCRFYARIENGVFSLDVFRADSDIADLSSFATQLFAVHYIPRLESNAPLSQFDLYQIELCIQAHLAYLESAERRMFSAMLGHLPEADEIFKTNSCCAVDFCWPSATVKQIDALTTLWHEQDFATKAEEYGSFLSANEPWYIGELFGEIEKNATHEIRDDMAQSAKYDFDNAEKAVLLWRELQAELYNGPLASLSRIHVETQKALSRACDVEGYAGLRGLMKRWRPLMRNESRSYAYLTADLPIVVMAQRAYAVTDANTHWYGNNREVIKRIAYQYVRATGDGAMLKCTRSHYAADQLLQYHRYVKKVLGDAEYGAFMNSLKMVKENELDHSAEDWFGEGNGASQSCSSDFQQSINVNLR